MEASESERVERDRPFVTTNRRSTHFFVTYDPLFSYGCRSMGFKSRRNPYLEVVETTGEAGQGREVRTTMGPV